MPCLAAVLSLVDVAQLDANVVGAPGDQYSASPTRPHSGGPAEGGSVQ